MHQERSSTELLHQRQCCLQVSFVLFFDYLRQVNGVNGGDNFCVRVSVCVCVLCAQRNGQPDRFKTVKDCCEVTKHYLLLLKLILCSAAYVTSCNHSSWQRVKVSLKE